MKNSIISIVAAIALMMIWGCKDGPSVSLVLESEQLEISGTGGTLTIPVTCNVPSKAVVTYEKSDVSGWLLVLPSVLKSNGILELRIQRNTLYEARKATITITAGELNKSVTVTQKSAPLLALSSTEDVVINVEGTAATSGTLSYTVNTDQPSWNAESDQQWLTVNQSAKTFTLSATTNERSSRRATVNVTAGDAVPIVLQVLQTGSSIILANGQEMSPIDNESFQVDLDLIRNGEFVVENIADIANWWIDPDFFAKVSDNEFTFLPITGRYRIIANTSIKYFIVQVLNDEGVPAVLENDGTGAVWVMGAGIGKPSASSNQVGWSSMSRALCMAPMGGKQYQLTLIVGSSWTTENWHLPSYVIQFWKWNVDWPNQLQTPYLTTAGELIKINGVCDLALQDGVTLEDEATYVLIAQWTPTNLTLTLSKK